MHAAGHIFEGLWMNDKRNGKVGASGTMSRTHNFKNMTCMNGCDQGQLTKNDGETIVAIWKDDVQK